MTPASNERQSSFLQGEIPRMHEGYYSGDRPNIRLSAFVEEHTIPYDPDQDGYEVSPFSSKELNVTNRRSAINDLHIYWSKKPLAAVRAYIAHYAAPGHVVLEV